jgi:alanyl-tRNA synthetase
MLVLTIMSQELGQSNISLRRKSVMRDRLAGVRKALDKEVKEREVAANKAAVEAVQAYFKEHPDADAYFAVLPVDGNVKACHLVGFFPGIAY